MLQTYPTILIQYSNLCFSLQQYIFISNLYQSFLFQLGLASQLSNNLPSFCFTSDSTSFTFHFASILCPYLATFPHLGNLVVAGVATFPHLGTIFVAEVATFPYLGNLVVAGAATSVHNLPFIFTNLCTLISLLPPWYKLLISFHIFPFKSL